jgi:periplasmic protein CpxP/Spy
MKHSVRSYLAPLALAASLAALAPAALAQGSPMGSMGRHGSSMMHLRGLDLTEAQRDQVFKIFHEQAPAMHEQMKQVRAARAELMRLASSDRFDETRARQAADAQAKALSALALLRAQSAHRVREILTPEQRQRLDQRRERHRPA